MASHRGLLLANIIPLFVMIGCGHPAPDSEPVTEQHAHAVSDNLLRALQAGDYEAFSRDFTPALGELFDQQTFDDAHARIANVCGGYVTVETPLAMPSEPPELRFETDAVFESEQVHVWLWFHEYDPRLQGLWLDSPGLH